MKIRRMHSPSLSSINIAVLFVLVVCSHTGIAQTGSDYFPQSLGSTWKYQRFDLDTINLQIPGSKTIITDSLVGRGSFKGFTASVIKSYPSTTRDSTIVRTNNDEIIFYNGGYPTEGVRRTADSLGLGFVPQALGWYPYLKFGTPPQNNKVDTLFRRDSTIFVDSTEFPLTLTISRVRRPSGVVTVPAGTFFSAIPFEITLNVNTWVLTPLGKFAVPLLKLTDTLFVAKNNWIVKEIQGSTYFPLTAINNDSVPHFRIPGYVRLLEQQTVTPVDREAVVPLTHVVGQNFPNPFNGATTIAITVAARSSLVIDVIDILGRFVDTIVRTSVESGTYRFQWDPGNIPSGVYLYRITTNGMTTTKKMILQK